MPACDVAAAGAQGLADETLTAHGLAVFWAHGLAACGAQGFTGGLAAQGLAGTQGFFDFGAQGFDTAQGFAAAAEGVPKNREANWSEGPSRVMAKNHGSSEKIAPLNQCGPGSHQKKKAA